MLGEFNEVNLTSTNAKGYQDLISSLQPWTIYLTLYPPPNIAKWQLNVN